jgi:hypothetical protein
VGSAVEILHHLVMVIAAIVVAALAGEGIAWKNEPGEGKVNLFAGRDGLIGVNPPTLAAFNVVDEVRRMTAGV